jgi:hypothetical protein
MAEVPSMKDRSASFGAGGSGRAPIDDRAGSAVRSATARDTVASPGSGARAHGSSGGKGTFAEALARMRSSKSPVIAGGRSAPVVTRQMSHGASTASAPRRGRDDAKPRREDDLLDPSARRAAQLAPPPQATAQVAAVAPTERTAPPRASLEALLPALVKRIAWSGDARRGTVRMELGAGALAGATLVIESNDGRVDVQLAAPAGVDVTAWRERIARRLGDRGLDVGSIVVE